MPAQRSHRPSSTSAGSPEESCHVPHPPARDAPAYRGVQRRRRGKVSRSLKGHRVPGTDPASGFARRRTISRSLLTRAILGQCSQAAIAHFPSEDAGVAVPTPLNRALVYLWSAVRDNCFRPHPPAPSPPPACALPISFQTDIFQVERQGDHTQSPRRVVRQGGLRRGGTGRSSSRATWPSLSRAQSSRGRTPIRRSSCWRVSHVPEMWAPIGHL